MYSATTEVGEFTTLSILFTSDKEVSSTYCEMIYSFSPHDILIL
jgi:hypothetical protein